jgi:hypothetical protein
MKKILIQTKQELAIAKMTMSPSDIEKRCIISMNLVSEMLAEECIINSYFDDSRLPTGDEIKNLVNKGLLNKNLM